MSANYLAKSFLLVVLVAVLPEFLNATPMPAPGFGSALAHGAFSGVGQGIGKKAFDKLFPKDDKITSVHLGPMMPNGCQEKIEYRHKKKTVTQICQPTGQPTNYQPYPQPSNAPYYPQGSAGQYYPQAPPPHYVG